MPIAEGIAAARLAMDAGSKALDLLRSPKIDGEAVRAKITEMQDLVFSAQRALGQAEEENRQLNRNLEDTTRLLTLVEDMEVVPDGGSCVRRSETVQGIFNPHCPVCFGVAKAAVPLVPMANGYYSCAVHKEASYKTTAYRDSEKQRLEQKLKDDGTFA